MTPRTTQQADARREYDLKRSQAPWRKWYHTARWKALRAQVMAIQPLCKMCEQVGKVESTAVVDHIKPHKGDPVLFWDWRNLQGLCAPCHDSGKQTEERKGHAIGCDESGIPLDPSSL